MLREDMIKALKFAVQNCFVHSYENCHVIFNVIPCSHRCGVGIKHARFCTRWPGFGGKKSAGIQDEGGIALKVGVSSCVSNTYGIGSFQLCALNVCFQLIPCVENWEAVWMNNYLWRQYEQALNMITVISSLIILC